MQEIKCIFCNKSTDNIVIEENGYKGRKCPTCGLIYISPRPSYYEILNLYGRDQAHTSAKSQISAILPGKLIAKHHLRMIRKFIRSGSMFEIGAGAGYFLDEAKKLGFDVSGIEINKILAEFIRAKLGIPCEEHPINISSFDGKKFDIIYHCDVISHFYDPIAEFEKINRKLKKGGFAVFETGNGGDIDKKYYKYFASFQYPDHLFFFSTANLKELLLRTGFELISIYRFSILAESISLRIMKCFILATSNTTEKLEDRNEIEAKSFLRQIGKDFFSCFDFLMRYTLGCLLPKEDRPQTIIIVARKK